MSQRCNPYLESSDMNTEDPDQTDKNCKCTGCSTTALAVYIIQHFVTHKVPIITAADGILKYSRLSLSQPRLFRITAYLEVKIWSLF